MTDGNDIPIREAFEWYRSGKGPGMAFWYKDTGVWWDSTNVKPNDGISLEEQRTDTASLWNYYRTLINLKKTHPALATGEHNSMPNNNDNVLSFLRFSPGEKIVVAVNLSGEEQQVSIEFGETRFTKAERIMGYRNAAPQVGELWLTLPAYGVQCYKLEE